jgi:hypothetical protein
LATKDTKPDCHEEHHGREGWFVPDLLLLVSFGVGFFVIIVSFVAAS